jgi:hypothetical protein
MCFNQVKKKKSYLRVCYNKECSVSNHDPSGINVLTQQKLSNFDKPVRKSQPVASDLLVLPQLSKKEYETTQR